MRDFPVSAFTFLRCDSPPSKTPSSAMEADCMLVSM
jgi:hypothetical protein